jgi:hypothetical protein
MKINWIVSSDYRLDPTIDPEKIKTVGPVWGSWKTWRSCATDNVLCHDLSKSKELIMRGFHDQCNFYTHKDYFAELGRPLSVKLYDGQFSESVDDIEDIISMHLAGSAADIVLLVGFDFSKPSVPSDKFEAHKIRNYHGMIRSVISNTQNTQWVVIDHPEKLDKIYQNLPNLTCDTMENALKLLI